MINWEHQEEGICIGVFKSKFFRDDEGGDDFEVGLQGPDLTECAEKCVEAFNNLSESKISEICEKIINYVKEGDTYVEEGEFELPEMENPLDILNYCWFTMLYVNMLSKEDETAYVVEGEGEWGEGFGFVMENDKVVYVGVNYFDYMKEE